MEHAKPVVVVSRCLGFDACRYNGEKLSSPFLARLSEHATLKLVCPEVEIGLGTPREPIRLVREGDSIRLRQPATGRDLTEEMTDYREHRLARLPRVDGFVLKSRSPSCGISDAKIMAGVEKSAATLRRGPGMFAEAVLERFPDAAIEDEGRLTNLRIREHFLARIHVSADFRRVRSRPSMKGLVGFQTRHKLLLMGMNQTRMRALGRIVANPDRRPVREVFDAYEPELHRAMARIPSYRSHVNVLMHGLGYFKKALTSREKAHFLDALSDYGDGRVPLSVPVTVLRGFVVRFEEPYLSTQSYFEPYPRELLETKDSGKGRGRS